jgi:hypothetical protein
MDFASLTVGCRFKHVSWPVQYVKVVEPEPLPSPNAARASALAAQFTKQNIPVPADVQSLIDNLLAVKPQEPAHRHPELVYVDFDNSESKWTLTTAAVFDNGFVLIDGETKAALTAEEAKAVLMSTVAGFWSPTVPA